MRLSKINFNQQLIGKLQVTFAFIALVSLLWYSTSSTSPPVPIANQNTIAIEIPDQQPPTDAKTMTEQSDQVTSKSEFSEQRYTVKEGDTLETIFKRKRLSINEMHEILETDEPYLQLDVLRPGDQLNFRINRSDNLLESLSRVIDPSKTVIYQRNNETFTYNESLTPTTTIAEVTRGQIEGSFYLSASSTGLSDNSVMTITQLLKNTLNFKRDLRAGDHFQVIMERETIEGQAIGKDRLLAARILSRGKEFGAYLHDDGSYYNAKGESLVPALLRYPTRKKYRISSHFNPRRVHPVTGRVKTS